MAKATARCSQCAAVRRSKKSSVVVVALCLTAARLVAGSFDGHGLSGTLVRAVEHAPCVRLFHARGSVGCRTPTRQGVTAPLYLVRSWSSADHKALADLRVPVAAVISSSMLSDSVLSYLTDHAKVAGVVVLDDKPSTTDLTGSKLSPDAAAPHGTGTPDSAYTIGASYAWNQFGSGIAYKDYDVPIILVTGEHVQQTRQWAEANGGLGARDYPQWTANFAFYFGKEGVTSVDCLTWTDINGERAPQCLPLGGQSVWASLGGRTALKSKSTVMAVAGVDGSSMFHDRAPSANEAAASIVALLAAADAVASYPEGMSSLTHNIAFGLFQADEWGFAGSRRFATDISSFTCENPIDAASSRDGSGACLKPVYPSLAFQDLATRLEHVVAVDQVGLGSDVWAVYDTDMGEPTSLLSALTTASDATSEATFATQTITSALPPTPLTSFWRANESLSGVVLAGYSTAFSDPRYHSHMDIAASVNATSLAHVASLLARSLYSAAGGATEDLTHISANATLVSELLTCLTQDWGCDLMAPYIISEYTTLADYLGRGFYEPAAPSPPTFYSSVIAAYQGLPLVQVLAKERGGPGLFASWGGAFDAAAGDRVYAVPKPLEAFVHGFLAYTASRSNATAWQAGTCEKSTDCPSSSCDGGRGSGFDCIKGMCVCRTLAFYHTALDPGIRAEETPSHFTVVDASSPIWTEPNWNYIGFSVFPAGSQAVETAVVSVGVVVAASSIVLGFGLQKALVKRRMLC